MSSFRPGRPSKVHKHLAIEYQQKIDEMIGQMQPQYLMYEDLGEKLSHFSEMILGQKKSFDELKGIYQHMSSQMDVVKQENIAMIKEIQQKSADDQENIQIWENQRATLVENCNKYKLEAETAKEKFAAMKQEFNGLKIEKLKLEENKRDEIESSYLEHHVEMMAIKNKVEREHMKVERLLREEIENKNQAIKDMSKYIQDLQKMQSDRIHNDGLEEMFNKLKEYNNLSQTINELRIQNSQLREANKDLQNSKKNLQAKYKESWGAEQNLQSQLQRNNIYLQEVQGKLADKLIYLGQLEKEKEEMDKYYSQRWVEEYKRVKNRLTKDFVKKINQIQENYNNKMAVMDAKLIEAIKVKNQIVRKNQFLESRYEADTAAKESLKGEIQQFVEKVDEYKMILRESEQMAGEEGLVWIQQFQQEKGKLNEDIKILVKKQENKSSQFESFKEFHRKTVSELNIKAQEVMEEKQKIYQKEKKKIQESYFQELEKMEQKISKNSLSAEEAKKFLQEKFQKQLAEIQKKHVIELAQKDQQIQRKHEKWLSKFYELDNLSTYNKNKFEREKMELRREMAIVEDRNKELGKVRDKLKDKINQLTAEKKEICGQNTQLKGQLDEKMQAFEDMNKKVQKMGKDLEESEKEVHVLIRMRKEWKKQLLTLQFDFKEQFTELKKQVDRQKQILKQKIKELEDIQKRKTINRKDYEELKDLNQQRDNLQEEVHVRQTQNVILTQIKDYYQTQLRQAQNKITNNQLRQNHSIFSRKIKRNKIKPKKESFSQKELEHPVNESQLPDVKRYAINSYQKQFNLSLNKARLEQFGHNKHNRVKTSYGL